MAKSDAAAIAAALDKHNTRTMQLHYVARHAHVERAAADGQLTIAEAFGLPEPADQVVTQPRPCAVLKQAKLSDMFAKRGACTDDDNDEGDGRAKKFKVNIVSMPEIIDLDPIIDLTHD